jgi:hypothetical protein
MSSGGRGKDRNQRPLNRDFHAYYEKRLSEGKEEKQVIICIMRKLVNILYSMMKNKTEYRLNALPERAAS